MKNLNTILELVSELSELASDWHQASMIQVHIIKELMETSKEIANERADLINHLFDKNIVWK